MADRDNAGGSPPLPSTSKGSANRGLPYSSRRNSGSPPRPTSSRGFNYRGWPSSSRGVTPRFRNFCITNEHPDGIVFCQPDGSVAENEMPTNEVQEVPPPSPSSTSSSSPSARSPSPTLSYCMRSPPPSPASSSSDKGTIDLVSNSEDEDDYELDETEFGPKTSKTEVANKVRKQKRSGDDMSADQNVNVEEPAVQAQPQPEVAAVVAGEENEVAQYIHHKKFHYKQVHAAAAARSKELNVDNLRLSKYINRDEAASRLKAIGDLQETQKEIDDFAAIICAGELYRLNLARGNVAGSSSIGRGRQSSTTSSRNQLPAIAELHEGSKMASSVTAAEDAGHGHGSSSRGGGYGAKACTSTAAIVQTAGTLAKDISIGGGNKDSYPVAGMTSRKGSYFQATPASPGHASSADDYEWISDADD